MLLRDWQAIGAILPKGAAPSAASTYNPYLPSLGCAYLVFKDPKNLLGADS
jgi:hypothetical protein